MAVGSHSNNEGLNPYARGGFLLSLACCACLRVSDPEWRARAWVWLQRAEGGWEGWWKSPGVDSRFCRAHLVPIDIAENWPLLIKSSMGGRMWRPIFSYTSGIAREEAF